MNILLMVLVGLVGFQNVAWIYHFIQKLANLSQLELTFIILYISFLVHKICLCLLLRTFHFKSLVLVCSFLLLLETSNLVSILREKNVLLITCYFVLTVKQNLVHQINHYISSSCHITCILSLNLPISFLMNFRRIIFINICLTIYVIAFQFLCVFIILLHKLITKASSVLV